MPDVTKILQSIDNGGNWDSQGHFFSAAAEAMRRILVDHARDNRRLKREGDAQKHFPSRQSIDR